MAEKYPQMQDARGVQDPYAGIVGQPFAASVNGSPAANSGRACRVTVNIFDARNLRRKPNGPEVKDPVFKLKVEKISKRCRDVKVGADQHSMLNMNQSYTFNVKDLTTAILSLKVLTRGLLGIEESLGCIENIRVAELLVENSGEANVAAKWFDLFSKHTGRKMPGKVYLHIVAGIAEPEQKISLFIGTWNVGNARPPKDLSEWLPRNPDYDIVAIGAQECEYSPRHPYSECSKDWLDSVRSNLGERYELVHEKSKGQMRLLVFVRSDVVKAISDIDSGSEATGVGHVVPNKGAVCVAFKFWDTGLCFVNAHFAAHPGQCDTRNSNYREIAGQMRVGLQNMDILNQYHHVFWFGDLNYRLDFSHTNDQHLDSSLINDRPLTPRRTFWNDIVRKIQSEEYRQLLQCDELKREIKAGRVLHGFREGAIKFAPTFKMVREDKNSYDQKRMPAWCDRILWRNLPGCTVTPGKYFSAPGLVTSDHKPVAATFTLTSHALPSALIVPNLQEEDEKRWHVQFTSLRAKRLRAADMNGFSDPYVSFIGPGLIHEFHSKVKHQTLNPVWNPPQDLPTLVFNVFPLQRLEKEYLFVKVLDRDYTSSDDTLGYAVIPLARAVNGFKKGKMETAHFKVNLTHHGLPAGTLEGNIKLTWENPPKRAISRTNSIIKKTLSFKETLRRRVMMVIP